MKKILSISLLSGIMTLIKMVMGFAISKIVAVYAGTSGVALLGQMQSVILSLNGIINSPVGNGVIKFTSENSHDFEKCSPYWRASILYVMCFSTIIIIVGCFYAQEISLLLFGHSDNYWIVLLMVFVAPITSIGTLINSILNGLESYKQYVYTGIIASVLSGLIMIFVIVNFGIVGALVGASLQYALIGIISFIINIYQPWLKIGYLIGKISTDVKKNIAEYIFMAIVSAVSLPLGMILIRGFLIEYTGWKNAGEWQAVWKISEAYLSVITMGLSVYYLPRLSSLYDHNSLVREVKSVASIVLPIVSLMAVAVYILRDFSISLLYTEQFREARELFKIQLIGDVIKVISWVYAYPMIAKKSTKLFVFTEIVFTITLVLLSYFFIKKYGVHGANLAYVLNYILYFICVYILLNKAIKN
ncbi:O-antigen translocase [Escherichia coli]|uniref:O-antigen translocase n=1 Tax=Escherichia TaxID=561 RepID=UPI0007752CD8|nr:O-antigen translocase [Escherichia coli]EET0017260.1 O-antigen translocase [Escherichia coli]EEU0346407.1 O-antigen translocase [Escherichia coli]EEU9532888.1 O-antigen translocase [Escherichia coli]EEV0321345.1 O-antigen translocase [Escherichia coli]EEV3999672.1 O-antigen translocase [Escherichia coli]